MHSRTNWSFAHVEAAEVFLEFTQESVGLRSGAALHAVLKGEAPCCPGRFGPLARVEVLKYF